MPVKKPVYRYGPETGNRVAEYESIVATENEGYNRQSVAEAARNNNEYKGYVWSFSRVDNIMHTLQKEEEPPFLRALKYRKERIQEELHHLNKLIDIYENRLK